MATAGFVFLVIAFVASLAAVALLFGGHFTKKDALLRAGRGAVLASAAALFICCAVLVVCFMTGDVSIQYVLEERSLSTDGLAWLYKLAGLWAGRAGSLLFWTFLIALFGAIVLGRAVRGKKAEDAVGVSQLDNLAMAITSAVVAVFCGVLLFSEGNMPFTPTPESFFTPDGELTAAASYYSMNQLLEHWAMAIHPPMLFIGYAGLTIPFAYAMAALITDDLSKLWVERATRFVLASWLFLGLGIGLGAVWAYVVLGWGGYWGWDPVENASLLSWLVCVALVHTFTAYRQRGAFRMWGVMCACLAFTFVIVATFITRSGIVQSVHAFESDPVSFSLFGGLIAVSIVVPLVGLVARRKSFKALASSADDVDNMLSKEGAYYFNNVIMVVFALLLTYMTLTSALPTWMPFGGDSLGQVSYEAIARPLGIVYLLILAACPLLAWGKTDFKKFAKQARIPAVCAVVLFALLMFYWATQLLPAYDVELARQLASVQAGTAATSELLEAGPSWYYNGLAVVGLLVASLLFFNAAFMLVRSIRVPAKRAAAIGGSLAHVAMAVILVGLIGSNMYVTEKTGYVATSDESSAPQSLSIQEYELVFAGDSVTDNTEANGTVLYEAVFDVYKDGASVGQVKPSIQLDAMTQQQKLNAAVISFADEDLFVVYHGVNMNGDSSLDVRVNPFISLVWIGFALLMIGTLFALIGPRPKTGQKSSEDNRPAEGSAK